MKLHWFKYLLLATFAFWATGAAKYAHEMLEHHDKQACVDSDDDDDDSTPPSVATTAIGSHAHPPGAPAKKECPICQMLAAMVVDRSAPPVSPELSTQLIDTLVIADRIAPVLHSHTTRCARGPPTV